MISGPWVNPRHGRGPRYQVTALANCGTERRYLIGSLLEGGSKISKMVIEMGVALGGAVANNGSNTHLLWIMREVLLQKLVFTTSQIVHFF